ncbi:MAG: ferredoxin--NADP reductase [Hyphomicrobiaceae bacterium]|nr:ferredoxin--NADP reductase [Hyphomicrobiaceae bacterium]
MLEQTAAAPSPVADSRGRIPSSLTSERVLEVTHHTASLFSFRTTRSPGFRFESGQFVMIGLMVAGRPLMRAYSVASATYDEWLEFFSIKVPGGPLTSRLQHIRPGDEVLVGSKSTGTLQLGNLSPAPRLWLLATGTGFAPFASILRDPETYERFEAVFAVEGCREAAELAFATQVVTEVRDHELIGELAGPRLRYETTVTREAWHRRGRITELIASGALHADLGVPPLDAASDRVMICGNPEMLRDLKVMLESRGFAEGSSGCPADFVIERAFVEK